MDGKKKQNLNVIINNLFFSIHILDFNIYLFILASNLIFYELIFKMLSQFKVRKIIKKLINLKMSAFFI